MKTSLLAAVSLVTALTWSAYSQEQKPSTNVAPSGSSPITATNFYDTVWKSENLATGFIKYLFLKRDGSVGYSKTQTTAAFTYDGTDTWKLEKGYLLVVWSNGFATEKYPIDGVANKILNGEKMSDRWKGKQSVRLSRITDN